ncbi:MAG: hypothetical protein ACM3WS_07180 [Bacillota bacterium]
MGLDSRCNVNEQELPPLFVAIDASVFVHINMRKIRGTELKDANAAQLIHKNNLHKSQCGATKFFLRNIFCYQGEFSSH